MNTLLLIAQNDLRLRLRRWSTAICLLVVVALTWLIIPDPSTGSALMSINNVRVIYDAQALAIGGVSWALIFFSFAGFYLVRGQSLHEIESGVGSLLASLPMSNVTFTMGRWLGAMAYLLCLLGAFTLTMWVLHLLRNEAPLDVVPYLTIFAGVLLPLFAFVISMALLCDAIPKLQGRAGDVLYFVFWAAQMSTLGQVGDELKHSQSLPWVLIFDGNGFASLIIRTQQLIQIDNFSIGAAEFAADKAPMFFPGHFWTTEFALLRLQAFFVMSLPILPAIFFFHRYDPAKLRQGTAAQVKSWWQRLNALFRPLSRLAARGLPFATQLPMPLRVVITELILTLVLHPVTTILLLVCWILQSVAPIKEMDMAVLMAFGCAGVLSADIGARHFSHSTDKLRDAITGVREWSIWQQTGCALLLFGAFLSPTIIRFSGLDNYRFLDLITALIFSAAASVLFATTTKSGKSFTALFLFGLYVFANAAAEPIMDFAGMHGSINAAALMQHTAITFSVLVALEIWRRLSLARC